MTSNSKHNRQKTEHRRQSVIFERIDRKNRLT